MDTCFSKEFFELLKDLRLNNNGTWYQENKDSVNAARKEMEEFANLLIPGVKAFDTHIGVYDAKQTMYKQHRDIRFSKDKTPLKTFISSVIYYGNDKKVNIPCYYMHIEEGHCLIAGGIHHPEMADLKKIRDEIFYHVDEFEQIINDKTFKQYFNSINEEEPLKNAPRGYPKDWPQIDYLKNKNFTPSHYCSIEKAQDKDFINYVLEVYKALHPFNKFMFRAMN